MCLQLELFKTLHELLIIEKDKNLVIFLSFSLYQLDAVRSSQRRKERTGDKSGSRERSRSANQRKAAPYTSPQDIQLDQDGSEQVNGSGEDRMAIGTNMATARHNHYLIIF